MSRLRDLQVIGGLAAVLGTTTCRAFSSPQAVSTQKTYRNCSHHVVFLKLGIELS